MRTEPSPCATWASEPAPPTIRYLAAKRTASSLKDADRHARVEDLDRVDVLEHVEQVLVVGHRVQAVERVGDVDEAALALDLGDRLLQRQPARDLLLDEQPDDLALVGGLDLLADDHLDPVGLRRAPPARPRSRCGRSPRSRPGPRALAVASSTSTGVAQSPEWSVCMCRSTSISGRPSQALRAARRSRARRGGGRPHGRRAPRSRRRPRPTGRPARAAAAAQPLEQVGLARAGAVELGGEHLDVAGLEEQAAARRPRAAPRRGAGGPRPERRRRPSARTAAAPGRGATPVEAKTMTSAWSSTSASVVGAAKRTRSRRSRRSSGCVRHASAISVARHGGVMGSRRSARRNRRWAAALLVGDEGDLQRPASARAAPTRPRPGARARTAPGTSAS